MKHLLFLVTFVCTVFAVTAQEHSVLSQGSWVKVSTEKAGIYRITYTDLKDLGIDLENLSSEKINLYGMPAGTLSEAYSSDFQIDLQKMAVLVNDNNEDGTFDLGDDLIFYGQGPVTWDYNEAMDAFRHELNPYCNKVYYFLRVDDESGAKRIELSDFNNLTPTDTIQALTYNEVHEKELYNPLQQGRTWVGELFKDTLERTYNIDLPGYKINGGMLYLSLAVNSADTGNFDVFVNGVLIKSIKTNVSGIGYYAYRLQYDTIPLTDIDNRFKLKFVFEQPNDSAFVYLDYYELNLNTGLNVPDPVKTINIKSSEAFKEGVFYYHLNNTQQYSYIWDVTDPLNVMAIKTKKNGDNLSFIDNRPDRNYYLFNEAPGFTEVLDDGTKRTDYIYGFGNLPSPELIGKVANQDVTGTEPSNMIIITNDKLMDAAKRLATFHQETDNISAEVYDVNEIYNEYSAGRLDPAAIRNFVVHKSIGSGRENQVNYLLMFGPAGFDFRGIQYPVKNQIPTYVSKESGNIINAYHTDSYYTNIGQPSNKYIASVGRIPVNNADEAENVVNKIEHYYTASFHDTWKTRNILIADNQDFGIHSQAQDIISESIMENGFNLNPTKLYLSLFEGEEQGYPQVKEQLLQKLSNGLFFVSFSGHSNYDTLTKEQIFTLDDAKTLTNTDKLPLWANGGSSTAMYDVPDKRSIGAEMVLNKNGGAIAYAGNSGLAFASVNTNNMENFSSYLFDEENRGKSVGDALLFVYSKNPSNGNNSWVLLGDPALKLTWPAYTVQTDSINGKDPALITDTIAPGSKIKLKGKIVDADGNTVSSFTGRMRTTVYDMPYMRETIEGENDPVREIAIYDSILTENCIDVVNGEFEGEVTPPAIYHEQYGNIKISYYGKSENSDAAGNWNQLIYGGKPSAIDEETALSGVKVYPVPFRNTINIYIPKQVGAKDMKVVMVDVSGKEVYQQQLKGISDRVSISLPELPKGLYFLNINSNEGSKAYKLMKE